MDDKHECLIKEFQSLNPPVFKGSSDISVAEEWFYEIEKKLGLMRLTDEERIILSTSMLKGEASHWWDINRYTIVDEGMTWRQFEDSFLERYYPFSDRTLKKVELMRLARMEYLDSLEKKRNKGKAGSSEISGAVKMVKLEPEEIDDVRICSPLRVEQEQQAVQDGAIEVRNANVNGELQQQRKQQKPEVAVVEVTGDVKDSRQQSEAAHTVVNLEEHQKQLQENMKQYVHQLVSQQVQQLHQQKQQQPLALVESNQQKQQQPLALLESNTKGQQIQQRPEVALVGASANLIGTEQQPEVAHGGSNILERVKEVQLQTKRYMHRVLLQMVQQLLRRKHQLQLQPEQHQQLQPEQHEQLQPEHQQQLQHWQQLIQKQKELHQHMQWQQQQQQQQQQPQKQQQEPQLQQHQQQEPQQQMRLQQQQQQHLHQQQKQQQQQQQKKQRDHQTPQNEKKRGKKRKHHNAEVALVQVNMEEFWANEQNRKKAKKIVKQVQTAEKQHSHQHPYTQPQQAPR